MNWRAVVPWFHLLAFWPLAGWYWRRMMDPADEPWGFLALVSAGIFLWVERGRAGMGRDRLPTPAKVGASLLPAALLTLAYGVTYPVLPPLVRSGLAVTALACSISVCWLGRPLHLGFWGLMVLSLPVMLSFEYYAGYPLRVAVAWMAAQVLGLCGFPVGPAGTQLAWQGLQVVVDAPCAGIRLLWVGAWLTLTLACLYRLGTRRTLLAGAGAFLLVLAGNVMRTAALFLIESGILKAPPGWHTAIGLAAFTGVAAGIAFMVVRLELRGGTKGFPVRTRAMRTGFPLPMLCRGGALFRLTCVLAFLAPCLPDPMPEPPAGFPGWPETYEGRRLTTMRMSAREEEFARTFPGRTGKFHDGRRVIILRWLARPSRQLHPIETCFKAQGYKVTAEPLFVDREGNRWGSFLASRGAERMRVRTRIRDVRGEAWSDISSWFWSAAFRKSEGPWWAVTVVECPMEMRVACQALPGKS